ncbi:MBL fold metallo-hydrolase RNA specificity domain-containing protein [Rheinheimera aquimaris]|jgi:metallo-beta-lactamase family protein|uniref:MBL fold metallo-hydrolase RNA specificity domain-containing protein n=1 Tax=Rheinheimera aquimaris TaxID=412437 RepID=UPI001E395D44|nr:MBL fold metallo-hydrolase [Rheinheimera aquimaris]MCD1600405.1 MBL fold metallo-hydrolase [Rheinheimera aquimaris]
MPLSATLQFVGAAQQVTGSCYLIRINGKQILLDCGMVQGADQIREWHKFRFAFKPKDIDLVILSHAHIDHSGLLPLLVARGFDGKIICTPGTAQLLPVLLKDSVHLYLKDLEWQNKKAARAGRKIQDPVLSVQDAERVVQLCETLGYKKRITPLPGLELEFSDAGHILGSAIIQLWLKGHKAMRKLVFSGDLGNPATVLMHDPSAIGEADIVLMESTYGDRNHQNLDNSLDEMAQALEQANKGGGNVFIPAFALGRSQEILYYLAQLHHQGRLKQRMIFLDSPMAINITNIYNDYLECLDQKDLAAIGFKKGMQLQDLLPMLRLTESVDESMAINRVSGGAIIIAGSGMCNGGRIVHHLKHNLWKSANHLIFVGFQAMGTLGRRLVDGERRIRLFGQDIVVKAKVHTIGGFSAHAGQAELLTWAQAIGGQPDFYLVHGEPEAQQILQQKLADVGIKANIPAKGDVIEL